jgi:hypothetical protein
MASSSSSSSIKIPAFRFFQSSEFANFKTVFKNKTDIGFRRESLYESIVGGHDELVCFILKQCPSLLDENHYLLGQAAVSNRLSICKILTRMFEQTYSLQDTCRFIAYAMCRAAAMIQRFDIIVYFVETILQYFQSTSMMQQEQQQEPPCLFHAVVHAAYVGNLDIIVYLNSKSKWFMDRKICEEALRHAVYGKHVKVIDYFFDHDIVDNPNAIAQHTALVRHQGDGKFILLKHIIQKSKIVLFCSLIRIITYGTSEDLRWCTQHACMDDIHLHDDQTLQHACQLLKYDMCVILIQQGANFGRISTRHQYSILSSLYDQTNTQIARVVGVLETMHRNLSRKIKRQQKMNKKSKKRFSYSKTNLPLIVFKGIVWRSFQIQQNHHLQCYTSSQV